MPIQLEPHDEQTGQVSSVFEAYLLCHLPIASTFPVPNSFLHYVILRDPWDKIFSFCLDRTSLIWSKKNNQLNYLYIRSLNKYSLVSSSVPTHLKWEKLSMEDTVEWPSQSHSQCFCLSRHPPREVGPESTCFSSPTGSRVGFVTGLAVRCKQTSAEGVGGGFWESL